MMAYRHHDTTAGQGLAGLLAADSTRRLLWLSLVLVAAAIRLIDLAAAPLDRAEASQALSAYLVAHGDGRASSAGSLPPASQPAPVLFHLNVLLFSLFGGADGLARLAPALAGVGLVLTPLLFRRYLGEWGALGTALLLVVSPSAVYFSRVLDGAMPAALGVTLLAGGALRFVDSLRAPMAAVAGLGLALAVASGASGWGQLLGLLLPAAAVLLLQRNHLAWLWPLVRPMLGRGLVAAGLGVLAMATGLALNPGGLAAIAEQLLVWLSGFGLPGWDRTNSPLLLLLVYEPLTVLAALVGTVVALRKRHGLGLLWVSWALVGLLQLVLSPDPEPTGLLWVVLPAAAVAGLAVEELVKSLLARGRWLNEGLHLPIALALWTYCGLALARFARQGDSTDLFLAGLTLLLQVLLTAAFGFAVSAPEPGEDPVSAARRGFGAALRAGGVSLGLVLLLVTFSTTWGLSHLRPADPAELLVRDPTSPEVRVLVEVAEQVSVLNTGIENRLPVVFLGETDPSLLWALRDFAGQSVAARSAEDAFAQLGQRPALVIAPLDVAPVAGYVGEVFTVRRVHHLPEAVREMIGWWLYRRTTDHAVATARVALWVREDLGTWSMRATTVGAY